MENSYVLGFRRGLQAAIEILRAGGGLLDVEALLPPSKPGEPIGIEPVEPVDATTRAAVIRRIRDRGDLGLTARELWAAQRKRWKSIGQARDFLESLAPANGSGPLVQVGRGKRGRFFLREEDHGPR